ncbi:glycosyltransferase family 4 protein [Halobaculum limi]|uniref:glycosyltransferase family 4 protein n=1 Tax=Halobaculum limi TaxID=3031916 RepID=UPI00240724B2|nr:glycosyltransferase family 1 protein [Halobaculum sp. YSMS11]
MVEEPDGAVQSAQKLVEELASRNAIEVVLYGNSRLKQKFGSILEVRSTGFASNSPFFGVFWERTVLPCLVNSDELDILLCPNGNAPLTPVNCPVVTYIHDVNAQKGMSSGIHGIYRKLAVPLGIRNSDLVLTVSEFSKREISEHLSVEEEDIYVVYNGLSKRYLSDSEGTPWELPENYLLYVGAMNPRKNVQRLVKAYNQVRREIPHRLVLIGPQNKSVYKKMDIDEFSDDIITPGFVSESKLKFAYRNADLFVYPSLYEGFGLPPLEAMAVGTPVVASDRASLPELLNGHCELVNPTEIDQIANSILRSIAQPLDESDRQKLRRYAHKFSWQSSGDQVINILRSVVDNRDF